MSSKIGRFEILSELAKSPSGCVYKASDPESGQTIALKTIHLEEFGEHAEELVNRILAEAEGTKALSSPNITLVYGAGEIDGQFCAAMEYIQGNSIQTMLARKEGFSIWDLLDISRQVCQGLDHAHQSNVFHYNLEPSKVMVTWDGTVKILSFGISSTGFVAAVATGAPQAPLYYMSPEQISGEKIDARSNLFTWGAMLYEMVTDQKAFPGDDADVVRQNILEGMPAPPSSLNPKINPVASEVIMKALAKDPAQRYQSGREMVNDLERCREASKSAKKAPEAPKGTAVPDKMKAAAASKFVTTAAPKAPSTPAAPKYEKPAEATFSSSSSLSDELETSWTPAPTPKPPARKTPAHASESAPKKAAAAAAGWSANAGSGTRTSPSDPSSEFVNAVVRASVDAIENPAANMSAAIVDEPEIEQPKIAVDPMMAESGPAAGKGVSFSDLEELPPLKEVYVAPPAPKTEAPVDEGSAATVFRPREPEKPKVQPREVAEKAIKEIKGLPPKLMLYSVAGAVVLIAVIAIWVFWHSHSQSTDEEGSVPAPVVATQTPAEPAPAPAPAAAQPPAAPAEPVQAAPEPEPAPQEPVAEAHATRKGVAAMAKTRGKNKKTATAPSLIPGQIVVDSTPEGAQVQVDGRGDPSWVTPYTITNLAPGQHTLVISKSGFGQETRTTDLASGSKASVSVHLNALATAIAVSSDPAGAAIFVDGKDTLRVTPSQISLDKGMHTVLVRKPGYLDETTSATGQPGQTLKFSPTLRPLGNVDDIKTVGKFKKLFGGKGDQAGMGKVSVKTNPKGAQVAVNRRMVDKNSPVDFLLSPGNYVVDITLTGYKPVQKVITMDKSGTISIDETLEPQ